jgi:hypothetical protein
MGAQPDFLGLFTIPQLHATLEHAITLVRQLGTRYIWIVSICINQKDAKDKEAQVYIKDAIYTGAWLTFVHQNDVKLLASYVAIVGRI